MKIMKTNRILLIHRFTLHTKQLQIKQVGFFVLQLAHLDIDLIGF